MALVTPLTFLQYLLVFPYQFRALPLQPHCHLKSRNYCLQQWALDQLWALIQECRPIALPPNRHHFDNKARAEVLADFQH